MLPNKLFANLFTTKSLFSFVLSLLLLSVVSVSVPHEAQAVSRLTGCLSTDSGLLFSLKSGTAPLATCPSGNPELTWSTFDITSGWTPSDDTWTYASATSFTVPGDQTQQYQKGTRLKFTQTTTKYGAVKSSSFSSGTTTVNIIPNDDYSLSNAAVTLPAYSYQASPQGYPEWFAYTPIIDGASGSVGSYATLNLTGYYAVTGSRLTYVLEATVSNSGSWSGNIRASLPVSASIGGGTFYYLFGMVSNSGDLEANAIKAHNAVISNGNDYLQFEKNFGSQLIQWSDVTPQFRVASQGEIRF